MKIFDVDKVHKEIAAQTAITQEFSWRASSAVSAYIDANRGSLQAKMREASDEDEKSKIQSQLAQLRRLEQALNILIGAIVGLPGEAITKEGLSSAAEKMRELMIEDSKKFKGITDGVTTISNLSGESTGVRKDETKLGGTRIDLDILCGLDFERCNYKKDGERKFLEINDNGEVVFNGGKSRISLEAFMASDQAKKMRGLTGGVQGAKGTLFGIPYEAGSWQDQLIEAFAGTHDLIGGALSGLYDQQGNIQQGMSDFRRTSHDRVADIAVLPSTPFALSELLPADVWLAVSILIKEIR